MQFDWPVIFLSIACVCNSVGVICLGLAFGILKRNQMAMREEIFRLMNLHSQPTTNSIDEGVSEDGSRAKDMEQGAHACGSRASMSTDSENLSKGT